MRATGRRISVCVFVIAAYACTLSQEGSKAAEVTLCDLYQHPEHYAGKMIRVRGGSVGGLDIADTLHDAHSEPCPTYLRIIVVFPDRVRPTPGFDLVRDESYKQLESAIHYAGPVHIDATYEGRFDAGFAWHNGRRMPVGEYTGKGYGEKHHYDARIVLHQVFDVWTMPLPRK